MNVMLPGQQLLQTKRERELNLLKLGMLYFNLEPMVNLSP